MHMNKVVSCLQRQVSVGVEGKLAPEVAQGVCHPIKSLTAYYLVLYYAKKLSKAQVCFMCLHEGDHAPRLASAKT